MPFQHANQLKHVVDMDEESDGYDSDATEIYEPQPSVQAPDSSDPLLSTIAKFKESVQANF